MTLKTFLETIGLHPDECTKEDNPILQYNILIKELKSDFKYKYTELTLDKTDIELQTITLKKEI